MENVFQTMKYWNPNHCHHHRHHHMYKIDRIDPHWLNELFLNNYLLSAIIMNRHLNRNFISGLSVRHFTDGN